MTSLAIEQVLNPVSATTNLPVFRTDLWIVSKSIEFAEIRTMISGEIPFEFRAAFDHMASTTRYENATMVK